MKAVALQLATADAGTQPAIMIDGAAVAAGLDLDTADFRQQMGNGHVSVLCERGTGADAGLFRATFYHRGRRFRAVLDTTGRIVHTG